MATTEIASTTSQEIARAMPADVWEAYFRELDAAPKTVSTYRRALKRYRAYLQTVGLEVTQTTRETIIDYRAHLEGEGLKPTTVNAYLSAVRSFYQWLAACRFYPDVTAGIKNRKVAGRASSKDSLTLDQARRVLDDSDEPKTVKELRDHAIIELMLRRGLRCIEVSRADVQDIRAVNGEAVLFVQGKGRADKSEFVVLGDEVLQPLLAYLDARGHAEPEEPLFESTSNRNCGGRMSTTSISSIAKSRMEECGLKSARLTAHSLRHTAVTFSLLGGASVQDAQAMARHADVSTTMIYAHNIDRAKAVGERSVDDYLAGVC